MATDASQNRGHDTVLDVDAEQIASVYAKAFLEAAGSAGGADSAVADLKAVVAEILQAFPDFGEAIRSAFLSHEERVGLIDRVLGGRVSSVVLNTLKVMSAHNRLDLVSNVAKQAEEQLDKLEGRVRVLVTAAEPLTPDLVGELESALSAKLGAQPVIDSSVDPDMIAGVKIRIGDTVYDGSLKTIFAKARQSIVDRAIERIEKDPTHFLAGAPAAGETE